MGVDVKGTNCKLWISTHSGSNGEFNTFSVGVSNKDMDGNYINAYQDVVFTRNSGISPDIKNGTVFDFEGWMSARTRKSKDGREYTKPVIVIKKANFRTDDVEDNYTELDEDIPF